MVRRRWSGGTARGSRKIGAALDKGADDPEFLKHLDTLGAVPIGFIAESYGRQVASEIDYWDKWAKTSGRPWRVIA